MSNLSIPTFTVVGHPNKGKSSIVATLAQTDQVAISQRSGTTEHADRYEINMPSGQLVLVDTPGFQRPFKALKWLESHVKDASDRANTVARFVDSPECQQAFPDEVRLLTPIVAGSAIIYVVDGSRPYGPEYEFEMEILRWSGQPRMALINPIENEMYIEQWQNALGQYFNSVKVFNPMTAEFDKQNALFRTFAHLNEKWQEQLNNISKDLQTRRQNQLLHSASILEQLLRDMCSYSVAQKVLSKSQANTLSQPLKLQFEQWIKQREQEAFNQVLSVYQHQNTALSGDELIFPPNLFEVEQWYLWGLNKQQLIAATALTGAMGGATLDIVTGGSSLMLGALGGGAVGAVGAAIFPNKIANMKIKGLKTGGWNASYGPMKNANFPYVILGRFLYFHKQVCNLNHANRSALSLSSQDFQKMVSNMESDLKKSLNVACDKLVKQRPPKDLREILTQVMMAF